MTKVILILTLIFLNLYGKIYSFTNRGMSLTDWSANGYYFFNDSLEKLKYNYVNYVAINGWVYQDTETSTNIYKDNNNTPIDDAMENIIDMAHNKNMMVLLKIDVDAKNGVWRGQFNPSDVNAWFQSYKTIMTQYAKLAENKGVEMFSIGCEFRSLSGSTYYSNWTNVIHAIRKVYSGKLIYSANWDEYDNVSFWDELDYIGIDAYFPLDTDNNATANDIKNDWHTSRASGAYNGRHWISEISNFCQSKGKNLFFTEIGYSSADGTVDEPWNWNLTPVNLSLQSNCYKGTIMAWTNYSWFEGMFWWDWRKSPYGGGHSDTHHTPMNKPAETVLKEMYGAMVSYTLTNTNILVIIPTPHYPVNIKVNTNKPLFIWSGEGTLYDFDWEDGTLMGWYPDNYFTVQGFTVYPFHNNTTETSYSGTHALKCHTVLTQGHSAYAQGMMWVELKSPVDLRGRTVSVYVWVPSDLVKSPNKNGVTLVFKDSDYGWHQGNWYNITISSNWVRYYDTLPTNSSCSDIKYLGVKIGCSGSSNNTKFDGYIYIDAYDFGEGNKYWLQVSDTPTFSSTILNIPDIPSINYMPSSPITKTGTLYWRIRAKSFEGWHNWSNPVSFQMDVSTTTKKETGIARYKSKAYPNPCQRNRNITFEYGYASDKKISKVTIEIYDISGNKILDKTEHPSQTGKILRELKNNNNEQIIQGLYIYRIIITYTDGVKDTIKFKKIVICD